ncbi:unnamed protein product [Didymodactylos carnosus]|uniref:WWE domain-containing protein n=1 Tax=Didymodactylos carnosus TaxID=1234261 RepID=A0A8S2EPK8_9BILA|nr:unnamed protein product [Didymodactylos carnosus]CAF4077901.1 unnamed protein product [Didymodactylos carnosus]
MKAADQPGAQWYWKSNSDPWSTNGKRKWTKYSDIESAIIEEAFNGQNETKLADLDNYTINLNDSIQISKSDPNKQRQIKRVLISGNESQGASSVVQLLATSSSSDEHWCDESEMSSGTMQPLRPESSLPQLWVISSSSAEHWCEHGC